jgi:hypothetical protein
MITDVIVIASVAMAAAFAVARFVRPDLRDQIERPKHGFQDRVRQYDRRCRDDGGEG